MAIGAGAVTGWEKFEIVGKVIGSVAIPLVIFYFGTVLQRQANEIRNDLAREGTNQQYVSAAIDILRDPILQKNETLTVWARGIFEEYAPPKVPVPKELDFFVPARYVTFGPEGFREVVAGVMPSGLVALPFPGGLRFLDPESGAIYSEKAVLSGRVLLQQVGNMTGIPRKSAAGDPEETGRILVSGRETVDASHYNFRAMVTRFVHVQIDTSDPISVNKWIDSLRSELEQIPVPGDPENTKRDAALKELDNLRISDDMPSSKFDRVISIIDSLTPIVPMIGNQLNEN